MNNENQHFDHDVNEPASPNGKADIESVGRVNDTRLQKSADYVPPVVADRSYGDRQQLEAVDIQQTIGLLLRRWKVVLGTIVVLVMLAGAYAFTAKRIYESTATMEIDTTKQNNGVGDFSVIDLLANQGTRDVDTQIAILKGDPIKKQAMETLSESERHVAKEFCEIQVSDVGDTDLVSIAVRTRDKKVSQKLADAICNVYINDSLNQNREQVRGARVYVEDQLKKQKNRLDKAQLALATYKKANKTVDIQSQVQALVTRISDLDSQSEKAKSDKLASQASLDTLRRQVRTMPDSRTVPTSLTKKPEVTALQAQLTQSQIDLIKAQQEYTDNHPTVVNLKNQINELKRDLRTQAQFEVSSLTNVPNDVKKTLQQQIEQLQADVWAQEARGTAVARAKGEAEQQLQKFPGREYQLTKLAQETAALQAAYASLGEKLQGLIIQEQAKVSSARKRFPAEAGNLVAPKKMRILMLALVLGVICGLALAAIVDRMDSRVRSDAEAENITRSPILAHVPQMDRVGQESLLLEEAVQSNFQLLESFQMARTNIKFLVYDAPIRLVMVTSTLPSEGKSTSVLNLAVASAQSGESVIVVDCDLRRPSMHRLFNLPNNVGFTSVIAGTATLDEALQETTVPGLRVLTSGPTPPNPFRMLNSRATRHLLQQLRDKAEFVIVDTPPALGMADAHLISTSTDGVLLVVSSHGAKKHELARTCDMLSQTGVEMLGVILNRVQTGFGGYYGYGYGYSYYQYGKYAYANADNDNPMKDTNGAQNGHAKEAALPEASSKKPKSKNKS